MNSIFNLRYHTIAEGERIHYRPLEEVQFSLETGYLELEYIGYDNLHWVTVIRAYGDTISVEGGHIGHLPENVESYLDFSQFIAAENHELHAFRWYPTHAQVAPKPFVSLQVESTVNTGPIQAVQGRRSDPKSVKLVPGTNIPYPTLML